MFRVRNLVNTTKVNNIGRAKKLSNSKHAAIRFCFYNRSDSVHPQRGRGRTRRNTSFIYCVIALEIARDAALSTVRTRLAVWRPFLHLFFGLRARGTDKAGTRKPLRETSQGNQSLVCAQSRESLLVVDLRSYQRRRGRGLGEEAGRRRSWKEKKEGERRRKEMKKTEGK